MAKVDANKDSFIEDFVNNSTEETTVVTDVVDDDGAQGAQGAQAPVNDDGAQGSQGVQGPQSIVAEGVQAVQGAQEPVNYQDLYNKEVQRTKSWEGRITAANARAEDLENKLKEINNKISQDTSISLDELIDNDPEIKAFVKEMGDEFTKPFLKLLQTAASKLIRDAVKPIQDKVEPIEKRVQSKEQEDTAAHYRAINKAHPDVGNLLKTGALNTWIEGLPYKEAVENKRILDEGDTQEVIEMLNTYKSSVKGPQTPQTPKPEEVAAATVVKNGPASLPKGLAKAQDFDGAFNEACEEKKK